MMKLQQTLSWALMLGIALTGTHSPAFADTPQFAALFDGFEPPKGWLLPPIQPEGAKFTTEDLGDGVYALISTKPPVDNSGFIVGDNGVLVIDSHLNKEMAMQIQDAIRSVTNKPILYLVNTNEHGDHTFGNYAFPSSVTIIAHRLTAEAMKDHDTEKALMTRILHGDKGDTLGDVKLRLPDIEFDQFLAIDLGGRQVELHHFGWGSSPGDTIVYEPKTRTAWTGNFIFGQGSIPWAIDGNMPAYLNSMSRFAATLDVETIIPGHIPPTTSEMTTKYLKYMSEVIANVRSAVTSGLTLEETLLRHPIRDEYLPPVESPLAALRPPMSGFHLWNIKKTYLEFSGEAVAH
jgi:glyoxylase-like metal-dependent hydrolase (beta-lactamase superfamily II)